jgi:hypothetical protein
LYTLSQELWCSLKSLHQFLQLSDAIAPSFDLKNSQILELTSSHILCKSDEENTYFYWGWEFLFWMEPWVGLVFSSFFFTCASLLLVTHLRCSHRDVFLHVWRTCSIRFNVYKTFLNTFLNAYHEWKLYVIGWNAFIEWKWKMMDQKINFWDITVVFKKIEASQITFYNVIDSLSIISWKLSSFYQIIEGSLILKISKTWRPKP